MHVACMDRTYEIVAGPSSPQSRSERRSQRTSLSLRLLSDDRVDARPPAPVAIALIDATSSTCI